MLASKTRACLYYPQNGKEKARAAQNSHHEIATRRLLVQEPIPKATAAGNLVDKASFYGLANGSAAGMKYTARIAAYKICPSISSVANNAPWIMTVAACYTDRRFPATVKLGNGQTFEGASLYSGKSTAQLPLEYGGTAGGEGATYCVSRSLKKKLVKGKIVVCETGVNGRAQKGEQVKLAGEGLLLINLESGGEELLTETHIAGKFFRSVSRGPSSVRSEVMKPDVTAPGVNILAVWPPLTSPTRLKSDKRSALFNIISGTSMSCPHVSGLAAPLKSTVTCPDDKALQTGDLNYPSFAVNFEGKAQNNRVTFKRTLTNVGFPFSTYTVKVKEPSGVSVTLEPQSLSFVKLGQKLSYNVTFVESGGRDSASSSSSGSFVLVLGKCSVRSPIAVTWQ
uniref:Subtilisin-like protease n=1 Tax=Populus alba TaxID=43335 RepID=A0A4U5N0E3_POPAL|nr:hypothetical protein D5086_0000288110 [Populus alba]